MMKQMYLVVPPHAYDAHGHDGLEAIALKYGFELRDAPPVPDAESAGPDEVLQQIEAAGEGPALTEAELTGAADTFVAEHGTQPLVDPSLGISTGDADA